MWNRKTKIVFLCFVVSLIAALSIGLTIFYKNKSSTNNDASFDLKYLPNKSGKSIMEKEMTELLVAGYQAWFACGGDNSPDGKNNVWFHWSRGITPSANNITFQNYPDLREYPEEDLYQTNLASLGNGSPSKLYTAYSPRVIDLHFKWMEEYNIDGVALQRFLPNAQDEGVIARWVKQSAGKYNRRFYIEYDISGDNNFLENIQNDWMCNCSSCRCLSNNTLSPNYITQNGKPVLSIWGLGFSDRAATPSSALDLINWAKNVGLYVMLGVPYHWREPLVDNTDVKEGFDDRVFLAADLIEPWTIGRLANENDIRNAFGLNGVVTLDIQHCLKNNVQYRHVVFPGFAWSNWNGGSKDAIPRNKGSFMWSQLNAVASSQSTIIKIAMFDEFDEGTAIAKTAEDYTMIPTDQYFYSLDNGDSNFQISSDFYLRLAGAANDMLNGILPISSELPIPFTIPSQILNQNVVIRNVEPCSSSNYTQLVIERSYQGIFNRSVDDSGFITYQSMVHQGLYGQFFSALITSKEFGNRRTLMTTTTFSNNLYLKILDRDADPEGLNATINSLRNGDVVNRIIDMFTSSEYIAKNNYYCLT